MPIRNIEVPDSKNANITFKESELAHRYLDGLKGIEFGAAAHNPFGLENCINAAPEDDFEAYKQAQVDMNGHYAVVDMWGVAHQTDLPSGNMDYVISSHMIEHCPDVIAVFKEWTRILRNGGMVFMIFPKHGAHAPDKDRPVTKVSEHLRSHIENWTVDTVPADVEAAAGGRRGHYSVWTLESMLELIEVCNMVYGLGWEVVEALETDDKVGNGHCVVVKVTKPKAIDFETELAALKSELGDGKLAQALTDNLEQMDAIATQSLAEDQATKPLGRKPRGQSSK